MKNELIKINVEHEVAEQIHLKHNTVQIQFLIGHTKQD